MNAYIISFNNNTSEWLNNFNQVQEFMSNLEKQGVVSNVIVSKFENSIMSKSFTYNYNGEAWEKR